MRDTTDNSYLEICFNDYIATRLNNLKGLFTQYNIKNIAMFSSRYAFMLYELFKMKLSHLGEQKYIAQQGISEFKSNLDISGKYKLVADLKRKVLEKAKIQINKHSDITIDYEIIKTGRTPTHIKFTAKYKKGKHQLAKTGLSTERQTELPLIDSKDINNTSANKETGFTPEHKESAKKHIDLLKKNLGIKNKSKTKLYT